VTARSIVQPEHATKKSQKLPTHTPSTPYKATKRDQLETDETIIACINFARMEDHGFYVNWLATNNHRIDSKKYGADFGFLCQDGTWQRRGFALFLLRVANLAVISNLRLSGKVTNNYHIVLQARTGGKEVAAKFYSRVGFEEGEVAEQESKLAEQVFPAFADVLQKASNSTSDYIHFIWESDDLSIFKNSTGTFGKIKTFSRRYNKLFEALEVQPDQYSFNFPFSAIRNHLMLLASNLDLFFLPFRNDADMHDFIHPSHVYAFADSVVVTNKEKRLVAQDGGWLNDQCIDFFTRWYVLCPLQRLCLYFTTTHSYYCFVTIAHHYRLQMDGTTKATEYAMFIPILEMQWRQTQDTPPKVVKIENTRGGTLVHFDPRVQIKELSKNPIERMNIFTSTAAFVDRMHRQGYFTKPWILIPLNHIDKHWTFVAILNGAYLGTPQDATFSGYLYYDSMRPSMTRLEEMTVLHNKGVFNILVYANLVYGHPRLTGVDIRKIMFDPLQFARISVPPDDFVKQDDGSNCGFCLPVLA